MAWMRQRKGQLLRAMLRRGHGNSAVKRCGGLALEKWQHTWRGADDSTDTRQEQVTGRRQEGRETDQRCLGWAADWIRISDR